MDVVVRGYGARSSIGIRIGETRIVKSIQRLGHNATVAAPFDVGKLLCRKGNTSRLVHAVEVGQRYADGLAAGAPLPLKSRSQTSPAVATPIHVETDLNSRGQEAPCRVVENVADDGVMAPGFDRARQSEFRWGAAG